MSVDCIASSHRNRLNSKNKGSCLRCDDEVENWLCDTCCRCHSSADGSSQSNNRNSAGYHHGVHMVNAVDSNYPAICTLTVEGIQFHMEVDSGASASMIDVDEYHKNFSHLKLHSVNNFFSTVTGEIIKILGKIHVKVVFGGESYILELIVKNIGKSFIPLLGRTWLDVLNPNWRRFLTGNPHEFKVNKVDDMIEEIGLNFPRILSGLNNSIEGYTAEILLKEEAVPIFHKAYSVPFKVRDKVEQELERLCELKFLQPVKHSKWASPIVVLPKDDGKIRICVDFKVTVNKMIKTEHYPLPRIDDIFAGFSNCKYFSVLDLEGAFQQILVSESSKELLTINTHKGLFQYTRLPFGISSAPSIFQYVMDQILKNMDNVACYLDDIIIGASTKELCKKRLNEVLSRLNNHNVQINLKKCKFVQTSVAYLGHVLSSEGIRPNPDKVKAIVDSKSPTNLQQLQAYLGLLNYYGRYIPNLSIELKELYNLLRKDVKFVWDQSCQRCFEKSKQLILENNILELYDPDKPIVITCDASPYGVGCSLNHICGNAEKPVLFASGTLSNSEKNYSQLHREALAIMFALKSFHKYIYGHKFKICTDHQALKEIFNPSKGTPSVAAARLQRYAVILGMYDYSIEYRRGKLMGPVDALSRLPLPVSTELDNYRINFFNSEELSLTENIVKHHLKDDKILSQVYEHVMFGWPEKITDELKPYFNKRQSLSTDNDCLYYGNRIVIPQSLKSKALQLLHEHHIGIVRMKMVARSYMWWYQIDSSIDDFVKSCVVCQQTQNLKKEVVTTSWPSTSYPFERIHIDFFHFGGKIYLLVVDTYSKWLEIVYQKSTTTKCVLESLSKIFAVFGFCTEIVSDNGPPFNGNEWKVALEKLGIKVTFSPPYHPQSNGSAERNVQTIKKGLAKFLVSESVEPVEQQIAHFLFKHRNTPSSVTTKSPSHMIFSYKPRIKLDLVNSKIVKQGNLVIKETSKESCDKGKCKETCDKEKCKINKEVNSQDLNSRIPKFKVGDKVLYRNHFKELVNWIPARVLQRISRVTYLVNVRNFVRFVHENQLKSSWLDDLHHPNMSINSRDYEEESKVNNRKSIVDSNLENIKEKLKIKKKVTFNDEIGSNFEKRKRKRSDDSSGDENFTLRRSERLKNKNLR